MYKIADKDTRMNLRHGNGQDDGLILTTIDRPLHSHSLWENWVKSQC